MPVAFAPSLAVGTVSAAFTHTVLATLPQSQTDALTLSISLGLGLASAVLFAVATQDGTRVVVDGEELEPRGAYAFTEGIEDPLREARAALSAREAPARLGALAL